MITRRLLPRTQKSWPKIMRIPQSSNSPALVKSTLVDDFYQEPSLITVLSRERPTEDNCLAWWDSGEPQKQFPPNLWDHKVAKLATLCSWWNPSLGSLICLTDLLTLYPWLESVTTDLTGMGSQRAWASVWENNPLWTNQEARAWLHQKTSFNPAVIGDSVKIL